MKTIAIVTGATSGIGREFVRQLDGEYYGRIDEFWAIGRSEERLAELAGSTYAPVRTFALDLTQQASLDTLRAALAEEAVRASSAGGADTPQETLSTRTAEPSAVQEAPAKEAARTVAPNDSLRVGWLVNSAGFGRFGAFGAPAASGDSEASRTAVTGDAATGSATAPGVDAQMVRLNCLALTELCEMTLTYMGPGSRIVNMASVAAYLPISPMATYAATKRFVLDVTRALNEDLRGTNIHACAVCPKAVRTRFWDEAGKASGIGFAFGTESAYDVVRKAIAAVERGAGSIITSPDMKLACAAAKVLPYPALAQAARLATKLQARRSPGQAR